MSSNKKEKEEITLEEKLKLYLAQTELHIGNVLRALDGRTKELQESDPDYREMQGIYITLQKKANDMRLLLSLELQPVN